jgi:hypothetical protein
MLRVEEIKYGDRLIRLPIRNAKSQLRTAREKPRQRNGKIRGKV